MTEVKKFWTFDLEESIREFVTKITNDPTPCPSCKEMIGQVVTDVICGTNPLHISFRYCMESEDGKFLALYLKFSKAQYLVVTTYCKIYNL